MSGYYQVGSNAAFIEIVVLEPQEYISFGKNDIKPVVAHSTQSWPTHPTHGDLMETMKKYGASAEITHNWDPYATTVLASVKDLELVYERQDDESHYTLLGVNHESSPSVQAQPVQEDHFRLANELIHAMPGLDEEVAPPCTCTAWSVGGNTVQAVIIHLNDRHHPAKGPLKADPWSRERIAQWTETLPFDLTLDPDRPKRQMRGPSAPKPIYDEIHAEKHHEQLKALMQSMTISHDELIKSFNYMEKAATKAADTIKHTFEVTFKDVDPGLLETLTGMSISGDDGNEEEA